MILSHTVLVMEYEINESEPLEQPTKLPAVQYYGLLSFLVIALGLVVISTLLMLSGIIEPRP
jgi:hypothetical protein